MSWARWLGFQAIGSILRIAACSHQEVSMSKVSRSWPLTQGCRRRPQMQGRAERETGDCARTTSCLCHGVSQQGQLGESLGQAAPPRDGLACSATFNPKERIYARNRWTCGYVRCFLSTVCLWYP
ncbi:hypothetical protein B0H65DRAFT_126947 [Neurospora tetraspora]|uniref:Secreted protein n=1 Tax=Neurospora tetraspora TaxID=94610 RepID=A0AAE0MVB3_9PEZI|nr:hypothetical protein B0H65DRAFT_126947 [Neurospora tetraspora]